MQVPNITSSAIAGASQQNYTNSGSSVSLRPALTHDTYVRFKGAELKELEEIFKKLGPQMEIASNLMKAAEPTTKFLEPITKKIQECGFTSVKGVKEGVSPEKIQTIVNYLKLNSCSSKLEELNKVIAINDPKAIEEFSKLTKLPSGRNPEKFENVLTLSKIAKLIEEGQNPGTPRNIINLLSYFK